MIKVFMVLIKCGFGGVKYFQEEKNALNFAIEVNEKVDTEYCTPHEYFSLDFSDPLPITW